MYVPDENEVVLASRSAAGPFVRAAVTKVRRSHADTVRIDFVWLEDSPPTQYSDGYKAGGKGHVLVSVDGAAAPLIRRLPRDTR
jgi:hypothetical protein